MNTKWILINVMLVVTVAGLAWQLRNSIDRFRDENQVALMQPRETRPKAGTVGGLTPLPPRKTYSAAEFETIPARNLFSELRAREEKTEAPVVVETPPLAVKPILVGVTIMGNQRLAAIVDPQAKEPANSLRKSQTKRLGDSYRGYTITDITNSAIVLESGTRREVIPLFDTAKRAQATGKTNIVPTRLVAFGGSSGSGSPGSTVTSVVPSASPTRVGVSSPAVASVGTAAPAASPPAAAAPAPQAGITRQATPGAPAAAQPWNQSTDAQGRQVIRTPFGDIVREVKPPQ